MTASVSGIRMGLPTVSTPSAAVRQETGFLKLLDDPAQLADNMHVIAEAVVAGGPDAGLALDLLVNLASQVGTNADHHGRAFEAAKALLPTLYEAGGLADHTRSRIRQDVQVACHRMCELAKEDESRPLSVTVAYIGSQLKDESLRPWIRDRIANDLECRGVSLDPQDDVLAANRFVEEEELAGAAGGFHRLQVLAQPLDTCEGIAQGSLIEARFRAPLRALHDDLKGKQPPACAIARINTGGNHWQTLLLHKQSDGEIGCHLLETHSGEQGLSGADMALAAKVDAAVVFHKSAMQDFEAPNGCGPLSQHFAQALERELGAYPSTLGTADEMNAFIGSYQRAWTSAHSPEDRHAAMVAMRAKLLESRQPMPAQPQLHEPSSPRLVAADALRGKSDTLKQLDDALNQLATTILAMGANPDVAATVERNIASGGHHVATCVGYVEDFAHHLKALAEQEHKWQKDDAHRERYLGALSGLELTLSAQRQALADALRDLPSGGDDDVALLRLNLEELGKALQPDSIACTRLQALRDKTTREDGLPAT